MPCVQALEELDVAVRYSLISQRFPDSIMLDAIKRLFEINETGPQGHLPFMGFLLNLHEGVQVVNCAETFAEPCLLPAKFSLKGWC